MVRDKYRIDAFIATGSMANVYAATHRNGSRVALKILHRELADDPSMVERFRREGYFANAIDHPGVVRAIDDDVAEDGSVFMVLELLEGENLEQRRRRLGGRIPLGEVLEIADGMLDVLAAAHDHQILHRDLKPENVFLTRKNQVKLLDFGVARFNDGQSSSDMTGIGMVLGTPAFMPPEQALGRREDVDVRSDIWSAGATLFTVLTGEPVHRGNNAKSRLIATARMPARPLRDVMPTIPRAVAAVIDRALAFDRADRWPDAKSMREALRRARMALDAEETATLDRPTLDAMAPTRRGADSLVPTRRGDEDEPTLARPAGEVFDDETTERRGAPLGERESKPPPARSVTPSDDDPTFALRDDALQRRRISVPPSTAPEPPVTERMPRHDEFETPRKTEVATVERVILAPDVEQDPAELFREALAQAADGTDLATVPRLGRRSTPPPPAPRPAAGAPPDPPPAIAPSNATTPGIGAAPVFPAPVVGIGGPPSAAPHSAPPPAYPPLHGSQPPPPGPGAGEPMPGVATRSGPPPALHGSFPMPEAAHASVPPPHGIASVPPAPARPALATSAPGPLLSTIVPERQNGPLRVLLPIVVGGAAGLATWALVVHQPDANASRPSAVDAASASTAEADASPPASASAAESASVAPVGSLPPAPPTSSASASTPPKPRPRPKPQKKPAPPPATATATPTEPPATEPAPPSPPPTPVPTDSLPTKDD